MLSGTWTNVSSVCCGGQMSSLKATEFFAGIGLIRMALERCGWSVVFANDIDPKKRDIYVENFGSSDFLLRDIREVSGEDVPRSSIATASFPCIDVSLAGNRDGLAGKHSSMYWEFHRIISEMGKRSPRFLLIENVTGLLTSHDGADLRSIVHSLNSLGYACDLLIVDAAWFVPQSRPRLFVIAERGARRSVPLLAEEHPARPARVMNFVRDNPDLSWRLKELPPISFTRKRLRGLVEKNLNGAGEWWDTEKRKHLYSQMSDRHKRTLAELVALPEISYVTVYKRVRPDGCRAELRNDGFAGCLRTPRGGSSKQFLIEAGNGTWRVRNMTPREYARLQGVPDSFRIEHVPYLQALFGFGDAVCVPAVEWVITNCIHDPKTGSNAQQ